MWPTAQRFDIPQISDGYGLTEAPRGALPQPLVATLAYIAGKGYLAVHPDLLTTLEFTAEPLRVLAEAVRVARHGVVLGVLNRTSLLAWRRRRAGGPIWSAARFYSPRELVSQTREVCGDRFSSVRWRTTLWPLPFPAICHRPGADPS